MEMKAYTSRQWFKRLASYWLSIFIAVAAPQVDAQDAEPSDATALASRGDIIRVLQTFLEPPLNSTESACTLFLQGKPVLATKADELDPASRRLQENTKIILAELNHLAERVSHDKAGTSVRPSVVECRITYPLLQRGPRDKTIIETSIKTIEDTAHLGRNQQAAPAGALQPTREGERLAGSHILQGDPTLLKYVSIAVPQDMLLRRGADDEMRSRLNIILNEKRLATCSITVIFTGDMRDGDLTRQICRQVRFQLIDGEWVSSDDK